MKQELAEAIAEYEARDPHIVRLDETYLQPRLGEGQLDAARRQATGGSIRRLEFGRRGADGLVPIPRGRLPLYGYALGRCADALARPIHSEYGPQKFCGFTIAWQTEAQARVRQRRRYLLRVDGVTGSPFGQPVYALAGDTFSTEPGGCEIGAIVRDEPSFPDQYCVQFRTDKDPPIDQLLQNDGTSGANSF
jgi:hypothetical protein